MNKRFIDRLSSSNPNTIGLETRYSNLLPDIFPSQGHFAIDVLQPYLTKKDYKILFSKKRSSQNKKNIDINQSKTSLFLKYNKEKEVATKKYTTRNYY